MGLGSADIGDLTAVRQRVNGLQQLLKNGIDPVDDRQNKRRKEKVDAAQQRTFKQCTDEYHELRRDSWKNAKHAAQWSNTLETYAYPFFGQLAVSEVSDAQVIDALLPIWTAKHETATRVLQRIRAVLVWSVAKKYRPPLPDGFWATVSASLPDVRRVATHHAACPYARAGALLVRVRDSAASDMVKLAFVFIVLTAARSGETRGAEWSEIHWDDAVWTIPGKRMKAGRVHRVPLSAAAIEVLKFSQKLAGKNSFVFPAPKGKPFSDMVFTQLLRRLEAGCTMHGFRSTFRDWAAEQTNYPRDVCEAALAHVIEDKTEAAYKRSDLFIKRQSLMRDWAEYLQQTATVSIDPQSA